MNEHPREHEELLAGLLGGERHAAEPEVARRLRECARCRAEWESLRGQAAELERLGAERRAELDELARAAPVAGEDVVRATLEQLADEDARRSRRRVLAWLAAAAVLIAGAWVGRRTLLSEPDPSPPSWLGEPGLHLVAPLGEVPRFGSFHWTYDGAHAETFTLRIWKLVNGRRDERVLIEQKKLKETMWTPEAQELEGFPARIEWEVEAFDEFHNPRGWDSARAWLP